MNKTQLAHGLGISRRMVYKLMEKGMPTDSLQAAQEWRQKNINPFMAKNNRIDGNTGTKQRIQDKPLNQLKESVAATQLSLETGDAKQLYANARALKEKYSALLAVAKREKLAESLVSKAEVEKFLFETTLQLRDGLMSCARRIAPEVAGRTNVTEIESILTREHRLLLENLAKMPTTKES